MGIRYLNKFLRTECKGENIKFINVAELSGKKIAIDISIYLYKFIGDDLLIENMYLMLAVFRYYNIIPIFIFDGKAPTEKKELLRKRANDKSAARAEFNLLKEQLIGLTDIDDKQEIINSMDLLKKQFITISREQIEQVKELIRVYGATYFDAPGEADELCASLVIKNKVWACLSEDMDMFVYGCPRVLRYLSLMKHTAVLYNTKGILDDLGISQKELREICVLSGTDYNFNSTNSNEAGLYKTLSYFKKFHKENKKQKNNSDFYNWLLQNTDYIDDYDLLINIYNIFDLNNTINSHENIRVFENIKITNGPIMKNELYSILEDDGFIIHF
jgi:5'-3' exonuclease